METWAIAQCFLRHAVHSIPKLPLEVRSPDALYDTLHKIDVHDDTEQTRVARKRPAKPQLTLKVDRAVVEDFEREYQELRKRTAAEPRGMTPAAILNWFFVVRLATILCAAVGRLDAVLACIVAQFVFAPYSCVSGTMAFIVWSAALFAPHYLGSVLVDYFLRSPSVSAYIPTTWTTASLTVSVTFIVVFFALDQGICAVMMVRTGKGKTAPPPQDFWWHWAFSCANCKSYFVVLLAYAFAHSFSFRVLPWLLTPLASFPLHFLFMYIYHFSPLTYLQHRLSHLPRVYEQSHKLHHHLYDCTPFDAHFFGTGAPEEWLALVVEMVCMAKLNMVPLSLGLSMLVIEWHNKGGHTRVINATGEENHHPDHHTTHVLNYASPLLDLLFQTCYPSNEFTMLNGGFVAYRKETPQYILLEIRQQRDGMNSPVKASLSTPKSPSPHSRPVSAPEERGVAPGRPSPVSPVAARRTRAGSK